MKKHYTLASFALASLMFSAYPADASDPTPATEQQSPIPENIVQVATSDPAVSCFLVPFTDEQAKRLFFTTQLLEFIDASVVDSAFEKLQESIDTALDKITAQFFTDAKLEITDTQRESLQHMADMYLPVTVCIINNSPKTITLPATYLAGFDNYFVADSAITMSYPAIADSRNSFLMRSGFYGTLGLLLGAGAGGLLYGGIKEIGNPTGKLGKKIGFTIGGSLLALLATPILGATLYRYIKFNRPLNTLMAKHQELTQTATTYNTHNLIDSFVTTLAKDDTMTITPYSTFKHVIFVHKTLFNEQKPAAQLTMEVK